MSRSSSTPILSGTDEGGPLITKPTRARAKQVEFEGSDDNMTDWYWAIPVVTLLPYLLSRLHYSLPTPRPPYDASGRPQPSEEIVFGHIRELENIGYRTVGTLEAQRGEEYVESQVRSLARKCEDGGVLDCEVWVQKGDGFHSFNIASHDVLKIYKGITNVILQIRAKNPPSGPRRSDKDAILLGSHIDSTLPAPGAADDGIGVGVMLDTARILIERNEPFDNSVIFLWNGGEETLVDGSHLYSTQHHTAKNVKAVINLEAAGTTGGGLLFQATSQEMITAFSYAPHPRGTAVAADVFATGVLISDTDFGQFERYLNVSGLDMALVGHSYFYHTQKDSLANIETGSAQHFTSNIQAIIDHLLSPDSPLGNDDSPFQPPDTVYFSLYDRIFISYSMKTADTVYVAMAALTAMLMVNQGWIRRWKVGGLALISTPAGIAVGLAVANGVGLIMTALGKGMSWFRHEHLPLLLFVPPAYAGHLATQTLFSRFLPSHQHQHLEKAHYHAQLFYATTQMLILQYFRIRSAHIFAFISGVLLCAGLMEARQREVVKRLGNFWCYWITFSAYMVLGVEAVTNTLDIFVPLAGRMGKDAPAEIIVATMSAACAFTFFPPVLPLYHRFPSRTQLRIVLSLIATTVGMMVFLGGSWWNVFDDRHPKRVGFQYAYNHTSNEHLGHIAVMDSGPADTLLQEIHKRYASANSTLLPNMWTENNADWDVLYPISALIEAYKFPIDGGRGFTAWPKAGLEVEELGYEDGVRNLRLIMDFTGLVWPTIAFDADIVDWSFDFPPKTGKSRYHVKVVTTWRESRVGLNLSVRCKKGEKLGISWSAIDNNQMVPATASRLGRGMPAAEMLLDVQSWAKEKWDDALDVVMIGTVVGVEEI